MENQLSQTEGLIVLGVLVVLAVVAGFFSRKKNVEEIFDVKKVVEEDAKSLKGDVETLNQKGISINVENLQKLTKQKLDELGESKGIKLDRRKTKAKMIAALVSAVEGKDHKLGK